MKKLLLAILFSLMFAVVSVSAVVTDEDLRNNTQTYISYDNDNLSSGNPLDLTPNNNDGTNNGATTGVSGIIEEAFDFDGSDYVQLPYSQSSSFTWYSWVYADNLGGAKAADMIMSQAPTRFRDALYYNHLNNEWVFILADSVKVVVNELESNMNNQWRLVVGRYDGTEARLDVWDDTCTNIGNGTNTLPYTNSNNNMYVGVSADVATEGQSRNWEGKIDETTVWEEYKTTDELQELCNRQSQNLSGAQYDFTSISLTYENITANGINNFDGTTFNVSQVDFFTNVSNSSTNDNINHSYTLYNANTNNQITSAQYASNSKTGNFSRTFSRGNYSVIFTAENNETSVTSQNLSFTINITKSIDFVNISANTIENFSGTTFNTPQLDFFTEVAVNNTNNDVNHSYRLYNANTNSLIEDVQYGTDSLTGQATETLSRGNYSILFTAENNETLALSQNFTFTVNVSLEIENITVNMQDIFDGMYFDTGELGFSSDTFTTAPTYNQSYNLYNGTSGTLIESKQYQDTSLHFRQEFTNVSDDNTAQTSEDLDPPIDANISLLNYTGQYKLEGDWGSQTAYERLYDGSNQTGSNADTDGDTTIDDFFYMNYSRPDIPVVGAKWQVELYSSLQADFVRTNFSLSESCLYEDDTVSLRIGMDVESNDNDNNLTLSCYYDGQYQQIQQYTGIQTINEENMFWEFPNFNRTLSDGVYDIKFQAEDSFALFTQTQNYTLTVDTQSPTISENIPDEIYDYDLNVDKKLNFTLNGPAPLDTCTLNFNYTINATQFGGEICSDTNRSFPFEYTGVWDWKIFVNDSAGNFATKYGNITVNPRNFLNFYDPVIDSKVQGYNVTAQNISQTYSVSGEQFQIDTLTLPFGTNVLTFSKSGFSDRNVTWEVTRNTKFDEVYNVYNGDSIDNLPDEVNPNDYTVNLGQYINISTSATNVTGCNFILNNSQSTTCSDTSFTFDENGNFRYAIEVTDSSGSTNVSTGTITMNPTNYVRYFNVPDSQYFTNYTVVYRNNGTEYDVNQEYFNITSLELGYGEHNFTLEAIGYTSTNFTWNINRTNSFNETYNAFINFVTVNVYSTTNNSLARNSDFELNVYGDEFSNSYNITTGTINFTDFSKIPDTYQFDLIGDGVNYSDTILTQNKQYLGLDNLTVDFYVYPINEPEFVNIQVYEYVTGSTEFRKFLEDYRVSIFRKDIVNNQSVYYLYDEKETNADGAFNTELVLNDYYRLVIESPQGEKVVYNDQLITSVTTQIQWDFESYEFNNTFVDDFNNIQYYYSDYINNSNTSNVSGEFSFYFNDPTNTIDRGCINVRSYDQDQYFKAGPDAGGPVETNVTSSDVCQVCVNATQGMATCTLNHSEITSGRLEWYGYVESGTQFTKFSSNVFDFTVRNTDIWGEDLIIGKFLVFLVTVAMAIFGITVHPVAGLGVYVIGITTVYSMGLPLSALLDPVLFVTFVVGIALAIMVRRQFSQVFR